MSSRPFQPEEDLLLVFPQWQGAGQVPGLRESALALAAAVGGDRRRREVEVPPGHPLEMEGGIHGRRELLAQLVTARSILAAERPGRVFAVGGDCGIEVAVLSHLAERYDGEVAVVWLDAHPDLNTPESSPSGHFHGMPLRVLLGDGDPQFTARVERPLSPAQVLLAGVRAPDPAEHALMEQRGLRTLSVKALVTGTAELLAWLRASGLERAYVHLDLDVCDPREVRTVACPTRGGIPVAALVRVLEQISEAMEIVGAGITEALLGDGPLPPALEPILRWFRNA
jgi:arginase